MRPLPPTIRRAACLAAAAFPAALSHAQTFNFAVNPASSSMNGNFSASATFSGTLIGNYNQTSNPGGTRTVNFCLIFCTFPPAPTNIPKTFTGTGNSSGSAATHPAGTYALSVNTAAGTVALSGLSTNLVGASTPPSFPLNASISYQSFNTRAPNYAYPFLGAVPLQLGSADLTALTVTQTSAATGTLAPAGPYQYTFSLIIPADVVITVMLQGTANTSDPMPEMIPATGTITLAADGQTAAATLTLAINQTQSSTTPQPFPPDQPIDLPDPLGSGGPAHLLLNGNIDTYMTSLTGSAALPASGTHPPCTPDFNSDGAVNIQDFLAFLASFAAADPRADFNHDASINVQDFLSFLAAYAAGC